jgi:hypothetical protein
MICNNLHKDQSLESECSFAPNPAQQREGAAASQSTRRPMLSASKIFAVSALTNNQGFPFRVLVA